jgi:hypothetical protein
MVAADNPRRMRGTPSTKVIAMTTLAHTGPATASANTSKRVSIIALAAVALIVGTTSISVLSQSGTYFTPMLAKELPDQAELRSEINRLRIRVATIHFPPYLAANLHELSLRLAEAGDNDGAMAAIANAVSIRRQLARANPERYAASLEQSLQVLSQIEATREASARKTGDNIVR